MGMAVGGGKGGPAASINVTPLIDVLLVLLIIFMVITPMLQKGTSVDMVKTDNPTPMPDADKEDALLVSITKDGLLYFANDKVSPEKLTDLVKDKLTNRTDKRVFVKADARAQYGVVTDVVDNVRSAGVDELGLLTEQRKQGGFDTPAGGGK